MAVEIFGFALPMVMLLAGTGLIVAEAFAPGAHFFVLGVGLFAAGVVGLLLPAGLGSIGLLVMAVAVLVATALTLVVYRESDTFGGTGEGTTSDSSSLRGKTGRVTERVTPSEGEVKLEGGGFNPYYKARSVDSEIAEGETVIVIDPGGGNVLTVESFAERTDGIDRELARERERAEREPESESGS